MHQGPYELLEIENPLGGPSQDFGLFQDVDGTFPALADVQVNLNQSIGTAYALYSNGDADESHDNIIARLNSNFTNVEELVYTFFGEYSALLIYDQMSKSNRVDRLRFGGTLYFMDRKTLLYLHVSQDWI